MATFEKVDGNPFGAGAAAAPAAAPAPAPTATDKVARRPTLSPVQGDPFQKVAKRPERSWGEAIKDTGLGIASGAANILGGAVEQRNSMEPTNIVRQGLRALDRLGVKGASETAALVPGTPSEIFGGRRAGSDSAGLSKATQMATDYLGESQSDALKQEKQDLQDTKGFFASAGKVLSSPRLIGNFLAEQVPNVAAMGAGTRLAAARAGERALAGALAKGLGTEAAETAATAAGHRAATAAATGMTTIMETGSAGQQTYQQAMAQPQSVWDANPEYKRMVAAGGDPQTVKETIARGASMEAQAITAPIAAIAGRIAAPFEADVFTRGLARKPKAMLAGAARETVEEGIQEGGSQLAGNLGQRQVDPTQAAWEGVPEAAGTGAAIGGLLGGGMAAGGAIASRGDNQAAVAADAERERLARRPTPTPPPLPPPPIPQMLALPPPEVMTAAPDGTITPGRVRPEVMAEPEMRFPQGRGMSAPFDGTRVAVRPQPTVPFPDATPDSIAGIANLVSQARRPTEPADTATAAAAQAEPVAPQAQEGQAPLVTPEVPAAAVPPAPAVAPPWVDAQTGEALREPTTTDIKQLLHSGLQYQVETHGGINTPTLLRSMRDQYGLPSARVRPLLDEVKGERRRGLTEPPADAGNLAASEAAGAASPAQQSLREAAPAADLQLDGAAPTNRSAPEPLASELQSVPGEAAAQLDTGSSRAPVAEPTAAGATETTSVVGTAPEQSVAKASAGLASVPAQAEVPKVATAAAEAATNPQNDLPTPTDAQKEAGNYKKGHVRINGHDISIENPAGSQRDPRWPALKNHYGYFKGTVGKDKDHVDVFMTDRAEDPALPVYVVDQVNKDGSFDEHKVIMGTASEQEARDTYLANYSKGWTGLGGIKEMSQEQFKAWVRDPKKTTRRVTRTKPAEAAPAPQPATSVGETGQIVSTAAETVGATAESGSALAKNGMEPAAAAAPAAGEPGPAYTPKVRRIGGSPQYDRGDIGTLGAYFTPGRIVNAYGNTRDRVIEFRPPGKDPRWQVKVQQVDSAGNPLPDEDPRWHSTIPSPNDLEQVLGKPVAKARKAAAPAQNSTAATDAAPARPQKQAAGPAVIEDLGEKLGGARKDLAKPTGTRPQRRADADAGAEAGPAWSKKYVAMEEARNPGSWRLFKAKKGTLGNPLASRQTFASQAEAEAAIPMVELARNHRAVEREPGNWAIARDVTDRKRVYLKDGFDSRAAALQYMAENAPALIDTKTTVGEDALPRPDKVMRIGEARREGDVQGQQFMDTFGFRGVEFGKWNNQDERQEVMNHAFDALVDLSELLNLPPRAMSLDGQIGLAFGARGHGLSGARAHYERDYAVINLTKLKGAGSLAHEWMHALDHYLGRQDGRGSEQITNSRGDKVMKASGVDDYFPLQRFGKFFVAAEKGGTSTFLMFESQNELDRAVKDLQAKEWAITARGMKMEGRAADAPSGTFVADVIDQLRTAHVSDAVQDQVYQLYLQTMPELSMRKHQIHRKSVPGFDPDAVRAFAYNMQHGSHQLARLRYAHKLQGVLTDLKDTQKTIQASPSVDTRKIVAGDALLEELGKRHEWIMNPTDSALTNLISSFGFTYYLGATPAAALVNVTQTALVSYPYLAARHGGVKAMNYLLAASRDAVRTVGNIQRTLTDPDELRAYQALEVAGAIEKTQAHNLAGIAEGGLTGYNPAWSKAMEIIGWGFHKTEVMNREATGMAAYRLARADGKSFDEAVKFARDAIFDTHFDYSNANRARFMQSGTAKVLLMFRQYSLNMTWALGRMVWQATKGQDPQVRQIARRNLTGLLGMSALFSGAMGLPMMGMIMGALNGIQATFGDDDEPWDAETELRAFLTGMLGQGGADLLLHGPADKLTGANISGRVGLDSLWIRDADRELDGRGMFNNLLEQAAGPMGGVLKNVLVGKQQVDEGHIMRGVETMLPKGLKDMIKAGRYATQGVNTLRGDPVVEDLSPWEILLQANGFAPEKVSRQYETTRALKNYEQHILDRRKSLVNAFAMALRNGDASDRASVLSKIGAFNKANPELAITSSGLQQSIKNRARYSARAEAGIILNPKLAARLNKAVTE